MKKHMMKLLGTAILVSLLMGTVLCSACGDSDEEAGATLAAAQDAGETEEQTEEETVLTGFQTEAGVTCYYDADGVMATGFAEIDGATYYFDADGVMATGFEEVDGATYYFDADGVMATGFAKIDGATYYFGADGVMATGYTRVENHYYYFAESQDADTAAGAVQTGLVTVGTKLYCFAEDGTQMMGWQEVDGNLYCFYGNGCAAVMGLAVIYGKTYYFDESYVMQTGWQEVDGCRRYFGEDGAMRTNQIVSTDEEGYCYVDADGVQVTSEEIELAVQFVLDHTDADESNSEKLKTCYDYLWQNYPYNRTYETPDASTMSEEAVAIFTNKYGNCYKYAAAFTCIAKVLGYDARVCVGQISSRSGGMTPHGWMEVKSEDEWYICDPDMQMNYPTRNVYMVTESAYPYRHTVTTKYELVITDGAVSWVE